MKSEKIVYIPEVVYTPQESKTKKRHHQKQAAAIAAATLLALSAQAQDNVERNKISSVSFPKTNVTQVALSEPLLADTYTIYKDGKAVNLVEMPDGSFVKVEDRDKIKNNNVNLLGVFLALVGFSVVLGNVLAMQALSNRRINQLKTENAKLRRDYDDFRESHPGLGVTTPRQMREIKRRVLAHDFSEKGDKNRWKK